MSVTQPSRTAFAGSAALDRPVVLVGLMGSGKTTVGRRLAQRLAMPFVDADDEIERAAGLSVADIFDRFGEDSFRDGERRVIARLMRGPVTVLATGGGAFMNPETRALILSRGIAIWLEADIATLAERVRRRDTRPLVRNADPQTVLASLAEQRNPVYAEAHFRVQSHRAPHDATVNAILARLAEWRAAR